MTTAGGEELSDQECPHTDIYDERDPQDETTPRWYCATCHKRIRLDDPSVVRSVLQAHVGTLTEVAKERWRQDRKWGKQNHEPPLWLAILMEEAGELASTMFETYPSEYERREHMRTEAIHVAAVAVQFIEWMDRQEARPTSPPGEVSQCPIVGRRTRPPLVIEEAK